MKRLGPYEIIQGYYLAHILSALDELGILKSLERWRSTRFLAKSFEVDSRLLNYLFTFLQLSTDLIQRNKKGLYKLGNSYTDSDLLSFQIKKFIRAYGPPFTSLRRVLHDPELGAKLNDAKALAMAFSLIEPLTAPSPGAQIATSLGLRSVIDLGCGSGTLLEELASRDEAFRGWGVDKSAAMCCAARKRLSKRGFLKRVKIIQGDAECLSKHFSPRVRLSIDGVFASSLLNELFSDGEERVVAFLKELKSLFPERVLVIADYYGTLNSRTKPAALSSHGMVHDVMQVVTGQGVPPGNRRLWESVYRSAGCSSLRAYEGTGDGLSWFYHVLAL